jgi:ATP-binding protein involved in chromosome partitioning
VGLLDADFYGPDLPAMLDLRQTRELKQWSLWRGGNVKLDPVELEGLRVMSVGLLIGDRQTFPANAMTLEFVLRQMHDDVEWGELDYLLIDLPPGTGDLQEHLFGVVPLTGVLIVVTPQLVAHLDALRLVAMLRHARVRIFGGVENMSGFACPHCSGVVELFPRAPEERTIWHDGVERLATLPVAPQVGSGHLAPLAQALRGLAA